MRLDTVLIPINNTRLFVDSIGNGPPILFLHGGFGLDASYFRPYLDPLSKTCTCLFLDVRGHGRSDEADKSTLTMDQLLRDFEAIRAHFKFDHWTVAGHSGGGLIAQLYALANPHTVSRVILLGSFGRIPFEAPDWRDGPKRFHLPNAAKAFQQFLKGIKTDAEYRQACDGIMPLFFADPAKADRTPFEKIKYRVLPFNVLIETYGRTDLLPQLPTLTQPLLAIHGRYDWRVPYAEAELVATTVPHGRFLLLEDAGHFPFFEKPHECIDAIAEFVA